MKNGLNFIMLFFALILIASCAALNSSGNLSGQDQEVGLAQEQVIEMIGGDSVLLARSYQTALGIELPFRRAEGIRNVADVYSDAGKFGKAAKVIKSIPHQMVRAEALNQTSMEAWNRGDQNQADQLLMEALNEVQMVKDLHEKAYSLAMMGRNFGSQGNISKAAKVLLQAYEVAKDVDSQQQKAFNYTLIAEFLSDIGQTEKAGEVLSEAYRIANHIDDTEVRITTMDRIAYLLEKDNQLDEARDVEENINEAITYSAAPDRVVAYYLTHGKYDEAFTNASRIKNPYSRVYTMGEVGKQAWMGGEKLLAMEILKVAAETSEQIGEIFFRERAKVHLSSVYCDLGQPDKAAVMVDLLEKADTTAEALQTLSWGYASLGEYNRAADVAARIEIPRYKAQAHYGIGLFHLKNNDVGQSLAQLDQAQEAAEKIDNLHLQDKIRGKIARAYADAGQPLSGIELAGKIQDIYYKETALYNIAEYYHVSGNDKETIELADRIVNPYYKSSILTWQAMRMDFS